MMTDKEVVNCRRNWTEKELIYHNCRYYCKDRVCNNSLCCYNKHYNVTDRQKEARVRQSMIMTLTNNIRGICTQFGINDYYRRLQELTTYEIWIMSQGCSSK